MAGRPEARVGETKAANLTVLLPDLFIRRVLRRPVPGLDNPAVRVDATHVLSHADRESGATEPPKRR